LLDFGGVRAQAAQALRQVLKPARRIVHSNDSCTAALDRLDRLRNAKGSLPRRYPPDMAACDAK